MAPNALHGFRLSNLGVALYVLPFIAACGIASALMAGSQLAGLRHLSVDFSISPRTLERAYHGLEVRGILEARPGAGVFGSRERAGREGGRQLELDRLVGEFVARAGAAGFTAGDLMDRLREGNAPATRR